MSRVLVLNKSVAGRACRWPQRRPASFGSSFSLRKKSNQSGSAQVSLVSLAFVVVIAIVASGAIYLYQVNDIATKGYEIKELEGQIQDLNKESKKMEIQEVELRSMQNIEKASQDLNLVNSSNITYVEINGPVAMR